MWYCNGEVPPSKPDSDGIFHCVSFWSTFCPAHVPFQRQNEPAMAIVIVFLVSFLSARAIRPGAAMVRLHRQNETATLTVIVLVPGLVYVHTYNSCWCCYSEILPSKRDSDGNWHCVSSWPRLCPHVQFVLVLL